MTKTDLVKIVAKQAHLTKKAADDAINAIFEEMIRGLSKGDKVVISGFGTFYLSNVKEKVITPFGKTDQRQVVKSHRVVSFRVGKPLRKMVWGR